MSAPSVERVQQLLADAGDHKPIFPVLRLMAFTGLRVGEALGLEWRHVDLVGRMVHVGQTVVTNNGVTSLGPPKSAKGTRAVPLDDETVAVLAAHRESAGRGAGAARARASGIRGWSSPTRTAGPSTRPASSRRSTSTRRNSTPTSSATSLRRNSWRRAWPSPASPCSWAIPPSR